MAIEKEIVIKRYLRDCAGPTPAFWEEVWRNSASTMKALAAQADERLVRECSRHLPPKAKLLEGGCGSGAYLVRFTQKGHEVIGVDFAQETVARLNEAFPELDVRVGNIRELPFQDNTFDAYYSGGVIEHFEDGLMPQLDEAFRVLKPGGVFLVTVPYLNVARRLSARLLGTREKIDLDGRKTYIEVLREFEPSVASQDTVSAGFVFHEYVLPAMYMRRMLAQAGFEVESEMPFSSRWGLLDLEPVRRLAGIGLPNRHTGHRVAASLLRLVEGIERTAGTPFELAANLIGLLVGNLKLYAARKSHPSVTQSGAQ